MHDKWPNKNRFSLYTTENDDEPHQAPILGAKSTIQYEFHCGFCGFGYSPSCSIRQLSWGATCSWAGMYCCKIQPKDKMLAISHLSLSPTVLCPQHNWAIIFNNPAIRTVPVHSGLANFHLLIMAQGEKRAFILDVSWKRMEELCPGMIRFLNINLFFLGFFFLLKICHCNSCFHKSLVIWAHSSLSCLFLFKMKQN